MKIILKKKVVQFRTRFSLVGNCLFHLLLLSVFSKLIIAIHTLIVFDGWLSILVSQPIKHLLYVIKKASTFRRPDYPTR